jgi:Ca2+-transporting ATPase
VGIGVQVTAATLPLTASLLGNAAIPVELWGLVLAGALLAWAMAEVIARLAWRRAGPFRTDE